MSNGDLFSVACLVDSNLWICSHRMPAAHGSLSANRSPAHLRRDPRMATWRARNTGTSSERQSPAASAAGREHCGKGVGELTVAQQRARVAFSFFQVGCRTARFETRRRTVPPIRSYTKLIRPPPAGPFSASHYALGLRTENRWLAAWPKKCVIDRYRPRSPISGQSGRRSRATMSALVGSRP